MRQNIFIVFAAALLIWSSALGQEDAEYRYKSPGQGQLISTLSTVGLIGSGLLLSLPGNNTYLQDAGRSLVVWGTLFGPVPGFVYAGEISDGFKGTGIRCGVTVIAVGIGIIAGISNYGFGSDESRSTARTVETVAVVVIAGDLAYDCYRVGDVIQDKNNEHIPISLRLAPAYSFSTHSPGLSCSLSW